MTKAVSTWSLHRTLGSFWAADPVIAERSPATASEVPGPTAGMALLDLPVELSRRGYDMVQICHFHLPTRDRGYLAELRASLDASGIELDAVLVDDGDL